MPRRKSDFVKNSKPKTQKDQSFDEILNPHQNMEEVEKVAWQSNKPPDLLSLVPGRGQ